MAGENEFDGWSNLTFEQDEKGELKKVEGEVTQDAPDQEAKTETPLEQETPEAVEERKKRDSRSDRLKRQRDKFAQEAEQARQQLEEVRRQYAELQSKAVETITSSAEATKRALEDKRTQAEQAFADAFERGDKDGLLKAQKALTAAEIDLRNVEATLAQAPRRETGGADGGRSSVDQKATPKQQAPSVSERTQDWIEANPEFNDDPAFRGYMLGVHEKLVKEEKVTPESDEYFSALDEAKARFNGKTVEKAKGDVKRNVPVGGGNNAQGRKAVTVQLDEGDLAAARRMGVAPDVYAKNKLKIIQSGYDPTRSDNEYVTI